jgi:hypothetical protein
MRNDHRNRILILAAIVLFTATARTQVLLPPEAADKVERTFEQFQTNTMKCQVSRYPATLWFRMRFIAGYVLTLPLREFEGKAGKMVILSRITPQNGPPAVFAEVVDVPESQLKELTAAKSRTVDFSGYFAMGQGNYRLELLALGPQDHSCKQQWNINAGSPKDQTDLPLALGPGKLASSVSEPWDGKLRETGSGIRATILLDAASLDPRSPKLRAWDRTFLLGTLISLLQQLPCSSVRLVAFNLEQRKEIFRAEHFGGREYQDLRSKLQATEVDTVSVRALQRKTAPAFLAALVEREVSSGAPSDVIIWLGPNALNQEKIPAQSLPAAKTGSPRFFYFEYFPSDGGFPDAIHHLTVALHGKVVTMHGPKDLGKGIEELLRELKPQIQ